MNTIIDDYCFDSVFELVVDFPLDFKYSSLYTLVNLFPPVEEPVVVGLVNFLEKSLSTKNFHNC